MCGLLVDTKPERVKILTLFQKNRILFVIKLQGKQLQQMINWFCRHHQLIMFLKITHCNKEKLDYGLKCTMRIIFIGIYYSQHKLKSVLPKLHQQLSHYLTCKFNTFINLSLSIASLHISAHPYATSFGLRVLL